MCRAQTGQNQTLRSAVRCKQQQYVASDWGVWSTSNHTSMTASSKLLLGGVMGAWPLARRSRPASSASCFSRARNSSEASLSWLPTLQQHRICIRMRCSSAAANKVLRVKVCWSLARQACWRQLQALF